MTKSAGLIGHLNTSQKGLSSLLAALPTAKLSPDDVARLVSGVRAFQRQCAGMLVELGIQATAHSAAGLGRPSEVVLRDGVSVSDATARQDSERARVAAAFPAVRQAALDGAVLSENLDVLARATAKMTSAEIEELGAAEDQLAKASCRLGVDSFRKKVHRQRDRIREDHGQTAADQALAETRASVSNSRDKQTMRLGAVFTLMQGTAVSNALSSEWKRLTDDLGKGHGLNSDQISAQALHDLIVRGSSTSPDATNNRPTVVLQVLTDARTLASGPHKHTIAETFDGLALCPSQIGQLACDCVIQRVESLPDGKVNVSRTSRTATPIQRAGLRALYDSCPISGAPWSQIEVHHVKFVSEGGETQIDNLIPISRRWHHLIHDNKWTLEMDEDRTLRLYKPAQPGEARGPLDRIIPPPVPVLFKQDTHELVA